MLTLLHDHTGCYLGISGELLTQKDVKNQEWISSGLMTFWLYYRIIHMSVTLVAGKGMGFFIWATHVVCVVIDTDDTRSCVYSVSTQASLSGHWITHSWPWPLWNKSTSFGTINMDPLEEMIHNRRHTLWFWLLTSWGQIIRAGWAPLESIFQVPPHGLLACLAAEW